MADERVDRWALDEVHFQQHGSRCRMWVPPEIRDPGLRHHPTRHSVGYFGAVRLREFMKWLYQTSLTRGRRVVVITDNAKVPPCPVPSTVAGRTRR